MDLPPFIEIDQRIESYIAKMKRDEGAIQAAELNANAFSKTAKAKMLRYGLIELSEDKFLYELTKDGWEFENFKTEKVIVWIKTHPFLYAIIIAIIGALLSLLIGISLWLLTTQAKSQEAQELKKQMETVKVQLDSVKHALLYLKKG